MMRSIWKGSINFGMVAIPAKLYSSTENKKVSFHQIHGECGNRIQMPKWCSACNRKLEAFEIKKGYEISEGQNIILEEADFQSLPLNSLKTIEVVEFVDPSQIELRCYDDCYFLSCEDIGTKAFKLFLMAMKQIGVVGVAKLGYREREHLSVVRPYDRVMLLQTLHYVDELRPYSLIAPEREVEVSDKETEMAIQLVKAMTGDFDHTKYHNDYREALERLIEAKLAGEVIPVVAEKAPASDVADALMASLNMVGAKAETGA